MPKYILFIYVLSNKPMKVIPTMRGEGFIQIWRHYNSKKLFEFMLCDERYKSLNALSLTKSLLFGVSNLAAMQDFYW
jgi:hypothetical protein